MTIYLNKKTLPPKFIKRLSDMICEIDLYARKNIFDYPTIQQIVSVNASLIILKEKIDTESIKTSDFVTQINDVANYLENIKSDQHGQLFECWAELLKELNEAMNKFVYTFNKQKNKGGIING